MGGVFAELGGAAYLSDGSVAPYLGGGISPRLWAASDPGHNDPGGATCTVHGQAGITFTRDSRARVYAELRFDQFVLGLNESTSTTSGDTLYPMEMSLQFGVGW
jgi:hypothetical protein